MHGRRWHRFSLEPLQQLWPSQASRTKIALRRGRENYVRRIGRFHPRAGLDGRIAAPRISIGLQKPTPLSYPMLGLRVIRRAELAHSLGPFQGSGCDILE